MKSKISRRDFLKISAAAGGGLLIAVYLPGCKPDVEDVPTPTFIGNVAGPTATPLPPFQWTPSHTLLIDQNGILTFTAFRSEMGQGIRTAGFVANTVAGGLNGFDRGFTEFREVWREVGSAADSFRRVLPSWFAERRGETLSATCRSRCR